MLSTLKLLIIIIIIITLLHTTTTTTTTAIFEKPLLANCFTICDYG